MASNGIPFNRFYYASRSCSPTRTCCLTGRHPPRYGLTGANVGCLILHELTFAEERYRIVPLDAGKEYMLLGLLNNPHESQNLAKKKPGRVKSI